MKNNGRLKKKKKKKSLNCNEANNIFLERNWIEGKFEAGKEFDIFIILILHISRRQNNHLPEDIKKESSVNLGIKMR